MATTPAPAADKLDPKVVKTSLVLIVGLMAVIFDTTIVSVALHTLALRMHTSVTTIQWVTTGYLLALGIAVPLLFVNTALATISGQIVQMLDEQSTGLLAETIERKVFKRGEPHATMGSSGAPPVSRKSCARSTFDRATPRGSDACPKRTEVISGALGAPAQAARPARARQASRGPRIG